MLLLKMTSWLEGDIEPARQISHILCQLITDDGDEHDEHGGGGRKRDVRRTSRMKAQHSHSTDRVRSRGNTDSHNSQPETRTLFLQIRQRQNVAPERKRFPLPPVQLREVFSSSLLFYLPVIKQAGQQKVSRLFRSGSVRISCDADIFANPPVRYVTQMYRIAGALRSEAWKGDYWSSS